MEDTNPTGKQLNFLSQPIGHAKPMRINSALASLARWSLLCFLLLVPAVAVSQNLEVVSPVTLTGRQEATKYERQDLNGNTCPMLIVLFDNDDVDFEGDIRSTQYRGNGEWWLWMVNGANWLTVKTANHTPLRLDFDPLRSGKTYELTLQPADPMLMLAVQEPFHADLTMTDAARESRTDAYGRPCALARIGLVEREAKFVGAIHSVYRGGEWYVWLAPGSTWLTVQVQGFQPLTVEFEPVQSSVTYMMTLCKAGSQPAVSNISGKSSTRAPSLNVKQSSHLFRGEVGFPMLSVAYNYRFSPYVSLGGGVGFVYADLEHGVLDYYYPVPVFFNAVFSTRPRTVSWFLDVKGMFNLNESEYSDDSPYGFCALLGVTRKRISFGIGVIFLNEGRVAYEYWGGSWHHYDDELFSPMVSLIITLP